MLLAAPKTPSRTHIPKPALHGSEWTSLGAEEGSSVFELPRPVPKSKDSASQELEEVGRVSWAWDI